jgi:hypothetical protein
VNEIVICVGDDRYPTGARMTGDGPLTEDDVINVVEVVVGWAQTMGVDYDDLRSVL